MITRKANGMLSLDVPGTETALSRAPLADHANESWH